ncbi:MAG: hypothetical protein DYH03_04045 [Nitrospira sp. NTP1]|nr:hypothetical protein [Nitrospira sp. NTP1]
MQNYTTTPVKLQPHKYHKTPATPGHKFQPHSSQPILNTSIEGLTQIGPTIPEALRLALQQTPPHKRAEAIDALAERGIWLTAENAHASLAGARA